MTEQTLMLLDRATRVPGVLQAFLVTQDHVVYSAASRGQALADDETWLAVAEAVEGLARYRIEADTLRWSFGDTTIILQKGTGTCVFGAVVKPTDLEVTTGKLRRRFRDFQIKIQAEELKNDLTDAFKDVPVPESTPNKETSPEQTQIQSAQFQDKAAEPLARAVQTGDAALDLPSTLQTETIWAHAQPSDPRAFEPSNSTPSPESSLPAIPKPAIPSESGQGVPDAPTIALPQNPATPSQSDSR